MAWAVLRPISRRVSASSLSCTYRESLNRATYEDGRLIEVMELWEVKINPAFAPSALQ